MYKGKIFKSEMVENDEEDFEYENKFYYDKELVNDI